MSHVHAKEATGYKSADIGMTPEDWDVYSLQDIVNQFVNGGTPSTKNEDFWSGNIPWVTGADILDQEVAVIRRHITAEAVDSSSTNVIPKGNLLIVSRTGVGKLAIAPCDIAISQDFTGIILRKEKILAEYLFRYLDFFQDVLVRQNQGTSIKGITRDTLTAILIAIPSYAEQRSIAEALSDVDGLIKSSEALIAKKKAIKQATIQQLLTGKTRLQGFSGAWEIKRLGEFAFIRNHKVLPSDVSPDIPCVELEHIGQGNGRLLGCSSAQYSTSSKYLFSSGDVLFGRLRAYLRKFWLADRDGVCTTEIWPLVTDSQRADSGFLYAIVQCDKFIETASISYGTHMPRTDWGVMRNFEVSLPEISEQRAIASVLSDIDAEITSLERRLDKTRRIKRGMMQQLLTGRLRLVKPV